MRRRLLRTVALVVTFAMRCDYTRKNFQTKNSQPVKLCCRVSLTGTNRDIDWPFVTADWQWLVHLIGSSLSQTVALRTPVSAADTGCQPSLLVTWATYRRPWRWGHRYQQQTQGVSHHCWSRDRLGWGTPWAADVPLPFTVCGGSIACWSPTMGQFLIVLSANINILFVSSVLVTDETKFGRHCINSAQNHQQ